MLKELNTIAGDLLGLHGYSLQPVTWAEIFGTRKRTPTSGPKPATHLKPAGAGSDRDRCAARRLGTSAAGSACG